MSNENTTPEDSEESPENIDSKEISNSSFNISKYKKKTICVAIILLILISWFEIIDRKTEEHIDQTVVSALVAFGSARAINAVVSVIKSADVDLKFLGTGVSASPGTALDPVDDMVEDFSTIMKISSASLVLQKILIEIVSSTFFKILLTSGGVIFIASLFFGSSWLTNLFFKLFLSVGMLRFLLILVLAGSTFTNSAFLQEQTEAEVKKLSQQEKEFQEAKQEAELSEKERAELNQKLEKQFVEKENIIQKIKDSNESLQESEKKFTIADAEFKEASKGRSAWDSINLMKTDPEYRAAKEKQKATAEKVERRTEHLEELNEKLKEKNEFIKEIKLVLSGKNEDSFLGEMKNKISGLKNALSLNNLGQVAEDFMDTSIRLMALFVLNTIILPLLFLYLGLKGFEKIWKINLPDLLKEKTSAGKEMLTNMRSDKTESPV